MTLGFAGMFARLARVFVRISGISPQVAGMAWDFWTESIVELMLDVIFSLCVFCSCVNLSCLFDGPVYEGENTLMPDWVGKIADAIKTLGLTTIAMTVAVVAAACLWMSEGRLQALHLLNFRNKYTDLFGPAFALSVVFVAISYCTSAFRWASGKTYGRRMNRELRERLTTLTPTEKLVLRQFVGQNSRAIEFDIKDRAVITLVHDKLLWIPGQRAQSIYLPDKGEVLIAIHRIDERVWKILRKEPEVLN